MNQHIVYHPAVISQPTAWSMCTKQRPITNNCSDCSRYHQELIDKPFSRKNLLPTMLTQGYLGWATTATAAGDKWKESFFVYGHIKHPGKQLPGKHELTTPTANEVKRLLFCFCQSAAVVNYRRQLRLLAVRKDETAVPLMNLLW